MSMSCFPSLSMSTIWPPTIPREPEACAISWITRRRAAGSTPSPLQERRMKASVRSASPARMAVASPYTLWFVGFPRRKSSLSMAGRSSCMRE